MGFGEKIARKGETYYRGRFKVSGRTFGVVRNADGSVRKFPTRQQAKEAANDEEAAIHKGTWRDVTDGLIAFGQWADQWYKGLDLAESTMANYRLHLETHLLPFFGTMMLAMITAADITAWERAEKRAGYSAASIRTWRATLHAVLEDAVPQKIPVNPAAKKRGKGKRTGRSRARGPEKVITSVLGSLLIAERMAILSGRDDEFVMITLMQQCGLRLGETVGLETRYIRPAKLRVEFQLHEVGGRLIRCPPKDDSYGDVDLPPFLRSLLRGHLAHAKPQSCPCHGHVYAFRGMGTPRSTGPVSLRTVAALAGVSETATAAALTGKGRVGRVTRERVIEAAEKVGYEAAPAPEGPAWHWRRSSLEELFTAAASGWLPPRSPQPRRPVPLKGEWPGVRVQGRNAQGRAKFNWLPVAEGLTPHGLRHAHRTWMEERRVPEVLAEERLRHEIPGVAGIYRHVTPAMRAGLCDDLEAAWNEALDARLEMSPHSPVAVLDGLLQERAQATGWGADSMIITRLSPDLRSRRRPAESHTASDLGRGGRI